MPSWVVGIRDSEASVTGTLVELSGGLSCMEILE